jgi:hypothetical protein
LALDPLLSANDMPRDAPSIARFQLIFFSFAGKKLLVASHT